MVGYSYGAFRTQDLLRMGIWLTIIESILLFALVPIYRPLIRI